ncbi:MULTISPECIES: hypothetical protein [Acidovorax]|uniref:Uncharacterized protein n=1 Tax=Acidovorax facilis TaxID=12917 RepID=A0ABV8DAF6_9BURK|nr:MULTISPECIES: hypothetical protein [Acidovorax]MBO1010790.1 hypothetical protein [Acidovorax sp. SD340]MCO4244786.1 hypothetical protein [Acidovorax facilis]
MSETLDESVAWTLAGVRGLLLARPLGDAELGFELADETALDALARW